MTHSRVDVPSSESLLPFISRTRKYASDLMQLTAAQIRRFEEDGFIRLDGITGETEILQIRTALERLFEKQAGLEEGAFFDLLASKKESRPMTLVEITNPSNYAPELAKTQYMRNATAVARQILGERATLWFDLMLLKPAGSGTDTPWHQDEAFRDPKYEHREITFWMPLQDVTVENGCMSFIPGSHRRPVLAHHSPGDDPTVHGLECCDDFVPKDSVDCPMQTGSCSIHYGRTLHHAGGNRSSEPRYAYILGFHVPPEISRNERSFPWRAEKQTAQSAIKRAWLLRGGIIKVVLRKWRRGEMLSLSSLRYGIRHSIQNIFKQPR